MAEANLDGDSSAFQKTVILRDWWLIKCSKEFEGKRFGVAGTEIAASVETRAMRVFTSSPIIKAFDVFTLQASDGICITLRGFLNKERVVKSGFIPEISREFIFGFPPSWEQICNNCFGGVTDVNTVPTVNDKACYPFLSPCKNSRGRLEDSPAESRAKSPVTEKNINEKDTRSGCSVARDIKNPPRLQSKRGGKKAEDERELGLSKLQSTASDGDNGNEGLKKAKSGDVEKDECEAICNEGDEMKLDESKVQNRTNGGDHGCEGLDEAKSSDVEIDECEVINNEVISPADGCGKKHTGADIVDRVTSMSAAGESLTSKQGKGEPKVTRASPHSLFEDLDKSSKRGKKGISKKSGKTLKGDGNVVEHVDHSGTKVKRAKNKKKLDASEVQHPTANDEDHGTEGLNKAKGNDAEKDECIAIDNDACGKRHSGTDSEKLISKNATKESLTSEQRKGKFNSSKPGKIGKSKKREKTFKGGLNVVEPMDHSGSEVKEAEANLSREKTNRKIDFDEEVTPDREAKKTNAVSADSLGQKRSRSGRVLVSSLEYWRNQIPVYDMDRNLIQVHEGRGTYSTPSQGKGSDPRKPRR
ncbi:unnamed protein product [Thlaspi arvense]|uniref:SANTA domain-containing protein n=1 Tax=Thlaspi arvense TaxID=13288 RepID=A0AAU9SWK7_THLAR|nr:unnamed protein product [Thlaspi arvense]